MNDSKCEIGAFVRARRKANHLTQQELGELAGVQQTFASPERGQQGVGCIRENAWHR
jgi:transcriptional regulator with XRE-family HTH domain